MPSEHQSAVQSSHDAARPPAPAGAGLHPVVAAARRRAGRAGDCEVDTGHLLHSLLEADPEALRTAAPDAGHAARLMGYLAQRSIGFGRRWQSAAEGVPILGRQPQTSVQGGPYWSRAALDAWERAGVRAACQGRTEPSGLDLLSELAADRECRAAFILASAGIDPATVVACCAADLVA